MTVSDCKALPIRSLLIDAAHTFEFILDEERHNMGQLYSFLFTIGKASGKSLLGSIGGWPPFGEARVSCPRVSLRTK